MDQTKSTQQQKTTQHTDKNPNSLRDWSPEQKVEIISRANPKIDNNVVRGYN